MYTILFADDAPDIRGLFCEVLRRAGYSVLEAEDGRTGTLDRARIQSLHRCVDYGHRNAPG